MWWRFHTTVATRHELERRNHAWEKGCAEVFRLDSAAYIRSRGNSLFIWFVLASQWAAVVVRYEFS